MLRSLVTNNFGWKLFSAGLAVALWLTIKTLSNDTSVSNPVGAIMTRTFNDLPVLVVAAAADVREFDVKPDSVQVIVSGRPDIIAALEANAIHAVVDLTNFEAARDSRKHVDVSTLAGVTVISVTPADVTVVVPPKTIPTDSKPNP